MTDFKIIEEDSESEAWEFYNTWQVAEVTGELADAIRARTGIEGTVTITERYDSWGTCEICGGEDDYFVVKVDDAEVFTGSTAVGFENVSTFAQFTEWLSKEHA